MLRRKYWLALAPVLLLPSVARAQSREPSSKAEPASAAASSEPGKDATKQTKDKVKGADASKTATPGEAREAPPVPPSRVGQPSYPPPPPPRGRNPGYPPPPPPDPSAHHHDGFYLSMSLGPGFIHDSAETDGGGGGSGQGFGAQFSFLMGGTPLPGLVVGGGLAGTGVTTSKVDKSVNNGFRPDDTQLNTSFFGVFGDYFFNPDKGTHVQALIGIQDVSYSLRSRSSSKDKYGEDRRLTISNSSGVGFGLGFGQVWWVSKEWSLGVLGRVMFAPKLTGDNVYSEKSETHRVIAPSISFEAVYH